MCFHEDGFVSRHSWEWIFAPILVASSPSEFENEHFFMQCRSVHVGRSWGEYSYLDKEITTPMLSVFIQSALQDFSLGLENLLYPLKRMSFIFCIQKQQQLKSLQYQCLYPHGSACITNTERGIFQPERQKHTQRSNPFLMTLATWKLSGIRGEREVMLAPFRLAGDSLAGINWLQLCCHFWPEWQFGRVLRCKKQSSNLFSSPALLPTATLFLLTSGWCSLPLFVCASACTPFPVVVAFERH